MENQIKDLMNFSFNYAIVIEKYKQEFLEIYSRYEKGEIETVTCKKELQSLLGRLHAVNEIMELFQEIIVRPDDSRDLEFYPANEIDSMIINVKYHIDCLTNK